MTLSAPAGSRSALMETAMPSLTYVPVVMFVAKSSSLDSSTWSISKYCWLRSTMAPVRPTVSGFFVPSALNGFGTLPFAAMYGRRARGSPYAEMVIGLPALPEPLGHSCSSCHSSPALSRMRSPGRNVVAFAWARVRQAVLREVPGASSRPFVASM